jgi:hypothetical protein
MPVRFIVTAVLLLVAGPLRGKKDRNLVFGSRPRTSASRFGFAVEKESGRFRGVKFKAIREGGAVGNLPGMSGPSLSSITIYQLRVVLCGVSPLVWRRLLVASDTSIAQLHEILQSAFDWSGEHLHRFLIHGSAYGIRCLGGIVFEEDARGVPLSRFGLRCGERFRYEYDFTADWTLPEKGLPAHAFNPGHLASQGGKASPRTAHRS